MKRLIAIWSIQEIKTQFNPHYIAQEEQKEWEDCTLSRFEEHMQAEEDDCCAEPA